MTSHLLRTAEVAALTGLRSNYLERLRCSGGGPAFLRLHRAHVAYRREDVMQWLNERRFANTCTKAPVEAVPDAI